MKFQLIITAVAEKIPFFVSELYRQITIVETFINDSENHITSFFRHLHCPTYTQYNCFCHSVGYSELIRSFNF